MLQDIINKINEKFLKEAQNSPQLLEDMAAMEKYMAENYSERVLIELLQNADDAKSKSVKLILHNNLMFFANNGRLFNEADVLAISRSGHSFKKRGKDIGYRGIGFKSTTSITDEILIYSNNTYFSFSKEKCSKKLGIDKTKIPTIRIPFNIKEQDIEINIRNTVESLTKEGFSTIFIFENTKTDKIINELLDFSTSYLIFLENINQFVIDADEIKSEYVVQRTYVKKDKNIVIYHDDATEEWFIVRGENSTALAFKKENGKIIGCNKEEAVFHCYLPTMDYSPYLFKINGNFSTDPSRKHIKDDEISNQVLKESCDLLFKYIQNIFDKESNNINQDILNVIKLTNFSKYSIMFDKMFKEKIKNMKIKTNTGLVDIKDYKVFDDSFENSDLIYIRNNSNYIMQLYVKKELYKEINNLEEFFKKYSEAEFELKDFIEMLEEYNFVLQCNISTLSQIYITLIKKARTEILLNNKEVDFNRCYIKIRNGVKKISEITEYTELDSELKTCLEERLSELELNWFLDYCEMANTKENTTKKTVIKTNNKTIETGIIISKWRSAEKQCVEIEEYLGNEAIDVSIRNLGYDVESTTPTGEKRYIEVKFLKNYGDSFSMTNNEYTSAHQLGNEYYLCLISNINDQLKAIYIQNPLKNIHFEKRIRQWEWFCEEYTGEEISLKIQ